MSKDAVATMGGVLPDDAGGRDAVHVAVFSATAEERLSPGEDVYILKAGDRDTLVAPAEGEAVGIVDPFLNAKVKPGQRFWVYLYPRTITALSHRWSHPAFEATEEAYAPPATKLSSEEWLRAFVERSDCPGYETLMEAAKIVVDGKNAAWSDEYLHFNDHDAHGEIPGEFWDHVEIVLGKKMAVRRPTYFSCSC